MSETTALARQMSADEAKVMEAVVVGGDLSKLSAEQRVKWFHMRCEAVGLDPRTQPFQYLSLQGKLTLYATKTATEQLCQVRGITTEIVSRERIDDVLVVTCKARTADGRCTEDIGAVTVGNLKGDALCNALMKAVTKAKRRTVLSLCGLGMLDETETATIPNARPVQVDMATGEVLDGPDSPGDVAARVARAAERKHSYAAASLTDQDALNDAAESGGLPPDDLDEVLPPPGPEKDADTRTRERFHAMFGEVFPKAEDLRHAILTLWERKSRPNMPLMTTQKDWDTARYRRGIEWLEWLQAHPEKAGDLRDQAARLLDAAQGPAETTSALRNGL